MISGGGPRVVVSTAAFHARVRGSVPGLGGLKETKMFLPHPRVKVSIVGSLRDREVACSASDRQGSNFESCVWRTVSSQSSHHPQEVLLAQFSLYVHKGGLKPDSFHFYMISGSNLRKTVSSVWSQKSATLHFIFNWFTYREQLYMDPGWEKWTRPLIFHQIHVLLKISNIARVSHASKWRGAMARQDSQSIIMFLPFQRWDIVVSMLCDRAKHFSFECFISLRWDRYCNGYGKFLAPIWL